MRAFSLFLVALLAVGCGSDDGDQDDRVETAPPTANRALFESERIAFTFEYPEDLTAEKRPRAPVLARVAIKGDARLNALQVRRTARSALRPERYLDEFERDFEGAGRTVATHEEQIGDLDAGVMEVTDADFISRSYFFTGAGQTWQLECVADTEHRAQIEAACRTALESVQF
jgi:hypothetical protein